VPGGLYGSSNFALRLIYEKVVGEQLKRLEEARDPSVVYVTDLVSCTHRFHMRKLYPELAVAFEPPMVLGDIVHWGLEALFKERGFDVEVEVSRAVYVNDKMYIIKGRVDAIDKSTGTVVEIKTARLAVELPKDHHVKQLNIYLELTGYKRGVLVYITPDRVLEYSITKSQVDLEFEVRELLEDKYRPRYPWECTYCAYRKLCPFYIPEHGRRAQ